MKETFLTKEELVQTWNEANLKKKEAEAQIELCKGKLTEMDIPLDEEIVDGLYVTYASRKVSIVPMELLNSMVGEEWVDYVDVNKKKFEEMLRGKDLTEEEIEKVKKQYITGSVTNYFQVKSRKDKGGVE